MPHTSVVEWIAGGTLPRQRRQKSPKVPQEDTAQYHSMGVKNKSGCCSTCCSCSGSDGRSEASTDSRPKKVHFQQPKGILKHTRRVDEEEHMCCSACTPSAHCNERHRVGKNGKVYGSSKKCAPNGGKNKVDNWGEPKTTSNSPRGKKDTSNNNYPVYPSQVPPSPPQTPEQRRNLQDLSSFTTKNMSRLILPSRAEVIIREDVLENPSDPHPNAFFDARTGMLRVYHGPMYGNPTGSLVPLQAQHVPIGTPAPPTNPWTNPWIGMMGGLGGRWPFSMSQQGGGGGGGQDTRNGSPTGNKNYSSGNKFNLQRNNSRGDSQQMPGSFSNDDDHNGNSGWNNADHNNNNANGNSNDDAWGTGNDNENNDSSGNGGQADGWGTDNNNNNNSSGGDNWGASNNINTSSGDDGWGTNKNNNTSSGDDNWGSGPDHSNNNNNSNNNNDSSNNSKWGSYKNRPNGTSQRIFPDATGTEFSAGSWGEPQKQESWGDKSAAQSTKNNSNDTSGW